MNSLLDTQAVVDLITSRSSEESIQSQNANTIEERDILKYLEGELWFGYEVLSHILYMMNMT